MRKRLTRKVTVHKVELALCGEDLLFECQRARMEKSWIVENMQTIMWTIEVVMLMMVAAVFIVYFRVKRKLRKK